MAEQLINEFTVNRPIDEAWPIITDVERIAPCLPGAQLTEIRQTDDGEVYALPDFDIALKGLTEPDKLASLRLAKPLHE